MIEVKDLIDGTIANTIYGHLLNNPEIKIAIQVIEYDLSKVGEILIEGNVLKFEELINTNVIKFGITCNGNTNVDVLYLPPAYVYKIKL